MGDVKYLHTIFLYSVENQITIMIIITIFFTVLISFQSHVHHLK